MKPRLQTKQKQANWKLEGVEAYSKAVRLERSRLAGAAEYALIGAVGVGLPAGGFAFENP